MKPLCVDMDYPEVEVECESLSDARLLMEDYSGCEGELTAISTYIYQDYVLSGKGPHYDDLSETLMRISIAEMTHHHLLGEAIVKLGGTPVMGGRCKFWNGSMVNYCKDPISMLNNNIKAEKIAIANYKKTIRCVENYSLRELIERIIMDEELHILAFEEQKCKLLSEKE